MQIYTNEQWQAFKVVIFIQLEHIYGNEESYH